MLADTRFPEGAAAFGIIMSAYGGGTLLGFGLAAALPKPAPRRLGSVMLLVMSAMGIALALLGIAQSTVIGALFGLVMGAANGYVVIQFITWLQGRTPEAMQGRMMSLLMFASVGLVPISMAVSGALIKLNMTATFVGAGGLMVLILALSALNPAVRTMNMELIEMAQPNDTALPVEV